MTDTELANVVGIIAYQQELDLAALAETFDEQDEITDSPTNQRTTTGYLFSPGKYAIPNGLATISEEHVLSTQILRSQRDMVHTQDQSSAASRGRYDVF
ncbi:hypothetical protein [Halorientalis regularis]|uniref:Uncharacterized protein n=1 Tax=Halorientalis regularis TaxID=660518 RepID=A0A1G7TRQ7_9EURY|nr:hypothetical protein [Halorientalis regularis]SDG37240.1 hypothetical protein SAMN05216218_1281 [Halorientalis regularis]